MADPREQTPEELLFQKGLIALHLEAPDLVVRDLSELAKAAITAAVEARVIAFAEAILHGDEEHRRWLLEAAKAFNAGEPLPFSHGLGAVAAERERCAGIVQLAREGELDSDFRSIISIIKYGDSLEQIQARD